MRERSAGVRGEELRRRARVFFSLTCCALLAWIEPALYNVQGKFERKKRRRAWRRIAYKGARFFHSPAVRFSVGKSMRYIRFEGMFEINKRERAR